MLIGNHFYIFISRNFPRHSSKDLVYLIPDTSFTINVNILTFSYSEKSNWLFFKDDIIKISFFFFFFYHDHSPRIIFVPHSVFPRLSLLFSSKTVREGTAFWPLEPAPALFISLFLVSGTFILLVVAIILGWSLGNISRDIFIYPSIVKTSDSFSTPSFSAG